MVLGAVSALVSSVFLTTSGEYVGAGLLLAIVGAVLVVAGHLLLDRAVSGIGIVGLLLGTSIFVGASVERSDTGAIAALVMGLIMVAGAIAVLQPNTRAILGASAAPPPATPPPPAAPPPAGRVDPPAG
jgi:hypothetical protein